MNVKIISDGTRDGTKLIDLDTGEPIPNVKFIKWEMGAMDGFSTAFATFYDVQCELVGNNAVAE